MTMKTSFILDTEEDQVRQYLAAWDKLRLARQNLNVQEQDFQITALHFHEVRMSLNGHIVVREEKQL